MRVPARRGAAGRGRSAPLSRRSAEARESRGRHLRLDAAPGLRGRQRRHGGGHRRRGIHRPGASGAGPARAGRPARERRRRAHHSSHQRRAHPGGEGKRLGHSRRALRKPPGGALPGRRRVARGTAEPARRRTAGGLAYQGHVQARHRREAPAPGRTHQPPYRGAFRRRARLDAAVGARRTRGHAYSRQAGRTAAPVGAGHGSENRAAHRRAVPQAPRHHPGDRPHRLGQDHHLVCRPRASQRQHPEHHDRRGSDRVLHRRHRSDPGEHQGGDDLRARTARHPAPGSGRGHGRRNSRPRDRADRRAGLAHRPPGVVDAAHQYRRRRGHAPARHGHRALPAVVEPDRRGRAAPGAHAEPRDQGTPSRPASTSAACWAWSRTSPRPRCTAPATAAMAFAAEPASTNW